MDSENRERQVNICYCFYNPTNLWWLEGLAFKCMMYEWCRWSGIPWAQQINLNVFGLFLNSRSTYPEFISRIGSIQYEFKIQTAKHRNAFQVFQVNISDLWPVSTSFPKNRGSRETVIRRGKGEGRGRFKKHKKFEFEFEFKQIHANCRGVQYTHTSSS